MQQSVDQQARAIRAFFRAIRISSRRSYGQRRFAEPRTTEGIRRVKSVGEQRLTVSRTIQLRTSDVMKARIAYAGQAELLRDGVELSGSNVTYTFTKLNALKPTMIAEANRNARDSAEQFAHDSGASVGKDQEREPGLFFGWSARW